MFFQVPAIVQVAVFKCIFDDLLKLQWSVGIAMSFLLGYFSSEFLVFYPGLHKGSDAAFQAYLKYADFLINGKNNCSHFWSHEPEGYRAINKNLLKYCCLE